MQDKKKKTNKAVKVYDLKPAKDPKEGGMPQDLKSLLRHLQLGVRSRQVAVARENRLLRHNPSSNRLC